MNDYIKDAINNISQNKLEEMRDNFNNALSIKAVEKLEEKKVEIAKKYFESK